MSIAYAAENVAAASSRQLTLSAMVLIGIVLVLSTAFALWSWQRRESQAQRRRSAEQALRASEDRVRLISGQLPVAIFEYVAAPPPAFRSISDGVSRLLPASADEILAAADAFFEGIDPDDRAGLTWRDAATPPPRDFAWVGRSRASASGQRWLQIRATTGLTATGELAVHGVMLDVSALMETQRALERSRAELRQLASHREQRVEQERARLAREFHDELGQVLTTARMQLQLLERQLPAESVESRAALEDVAAMIGEASRSVKIIASDLRPAALNLGLTAAVEWLVARVLAPAGVGCTISITPVADRLEDSQAMAIFRIVQESLSNVVRHAGAHLVQITLAALDDELHLLIEDDGAGFVVEAVDHSAHFGLLGNAERVMALGGTIEVDSRPGEGTRVSVTLPQEAGTKAGQVTEATA